MENEGEPIHGANISSHPSPEGDEALGLTQSLQMSGFL